MYPNVTCAPISRCGCLAALIVLSLLLPGVGRAEGPPQLDGSIEYKAGWRTGDEAAVILSQTTAQFHYRREWSGGRAVNAVWRGRYESRLGPEVETESDLREFYVTQRGTDATLILGRQQVVWGKTDGLRLLDVVNPLDLREFILDEFVDTRIPLWMANLEWFTDAGALQVLVIPDRRGNRYAEAGSEYYIQPDLPAGVPVLVRDTIEPDNTIEAWEGGLRWSQTAGRWDLTLNALYAWSDAPVLERRWLAAPGGAAEVTPRYVRQRLVGASADRPFGEIVLRLEGVYTPDEYLDVQTPDGLGGVAPQQLLRYAVGLDWLKNNWLLSPQLFQEFVLDAPRTLSGDARRSYISILVDRHWRQDRLHARLFYLYGLDNYDQWLSPRLAYQWRGRLEAAIGVDVFGGERTGLFGQFKDRDRAWMRWRWLF